MNNKLQNYKINYYSQFILSLFSELEMNINSDKPNHRNFCYVASNTKIPDLEYMNKAKKLFLLHNTTQEDQIYAKYICTNCSTRKSPVAKKDQENPHYRCIKSGCCPLPFHWNMCETCIQNRYFPVKVDDAKRKLDAHKFQRVFSKLPEDIQHLICEYVPTVFAFTRISSRLFHRSRELGRHLHNQSNKTMANIHGALICIDFAEKRTRTSLTNKHKYIREKTMELYEYLSDAHCSTIICDEDFWRLRINEGLRLLLRRNEILEHIKKLLCPTDIRKYFAPVSEN